MSNWTHVAGIVRIDTYNIANPETEEQIREVFGKTLHYTDPGEVWDEAFSHRDRFLPCGSEGSLDMTVWINPNKNYLNRATVSIFGDLRDHDNPDEIIDWFKEKCSKFWIRNASIVVDNEWNGVRTWHSCGEEDSNDNTVATLKHIQIPVGGVQTGVWEDIYACSACEEFLGNKEAIKRYRCCPYCGREIKNGEEDAV